MQLLPRHLFPRCLPPTPSFLCSSSFSSSSSSYFSRGEALKGAAARKKHFGVKKDKMAAMDAIIQAAAEPSKQSRMLGRDSSGMLEGPLGDDPSLGEQEQVRVPGPTRHLCRIAP